MTHELTWNTSMMVSAIILVLTFLGIFTEGVHGFHRTKFAMLGAGLMIFFGQWFGFYNAELAIQAIDWNVVFLLGAMKYLFRKELAVIPNTAGFTNTQQVTDPKICFNFFAAPASIHPH